MVITTVFRFEYPGLLLHFCHIKGNLIWCLHFIFVFVCVFILYVFVCMHVFIHLYMYMWLVSAAISSYLSFVCVGMSSMWCMHAIFACARKHLIYGVC